MSVGVGETAGSSGDGAGAPPERVSDRGRAWTLIAVILASSMGFIDGSIIGVALPAIARDLGAPFEALQWTVGGYLLSLAALLAVGGGLGDRYGRRRVFQIGVAGFALASAACALAPSASMLVAARIVQGAFAAAMIPQSLAIIAAIYPRERRGAAIGLWASASALTTAFGPVLGGLLVEHVGWGAVFWINPPIAAAALAISVVWMPESRAPGAAASPPDWLGAALLSAGLGAIAWAIVAWPERGADAALLGALALGAAVLALLPRVERRAVRPILPPALFAAPGFAAATATTALLYGGLAAVLFLLPLDLVARHGYAESEVGLMLLPFALVIGLFSRAAGGLADRFGPGRPIALGAVVFAVGSAALAAAPTSLSYWVWLFPAIVALGAGMTLAVAPLTAAVLDAAPDALSGAASGVNNTAARAAGLVSVAAVGALAAAVYANAAGFARAPRLEAALAAPGAGGAALDAAMAVGYLACAGLGLGALAAAAALPARAPRL